MIKSLSVCSAAIFFFATSLLLIRMMQAVFLPSIFL